jgi:hypothetical protein
MGKFKAENERMEVRGGGGRGGRGGGGRGREGRGEGGGGYMNSSAPVSKATMYTNTCRQLQYV